MVERIEEEYAVTFGDPKPLVALPLPLFLSTLRFFKCFSKAAVADGLITGIFAPKPVKRDVPPEDETALLLDFASLFWLPSVIDKDGDGDKLLKLLLPLTLLLLLVASIGTDEKRFAEDGAMFMFVEAATHEDDDATTARVDNDGD